MLKNLHILVCCILLSSCTVGPNYEKPKLDLPKTKGTGTLISIKDEWWKVFSNKYLNELEIKAIEHNHDIKIAAANIEEAAAQAGIARGDFFPSIGLNAEEAHTKLSKKGKFSWSSAAMSLKTKNYILGLGLSYEIDFWGKYRRSNEALLAELTASKAASDTVAITVTSEVAKIYFSVLAFSERLQILKRISAISKNLVKLTDIKVRNGYASAIDLLNAQAQLHAAEISVFEIEQLLKKSISTLSILLGSSPKEIATPANFIRSKLSCIKQKINIPANLPSDLLLRRPDIYEAENKLIAANAMIGVAHADFFPSFSLTGNYGYESQHLSSVCSKGADFWGYTTGISLPIFSGNKIRMNEFAAKARYNKSLNHYMKTVQTAFKETLDALVVFKKTNQMLELKTLQHNNLQKMYNLFSEQKKTGAISNMELLEHEKGLLLSKIELITSKQNQLIAVVTLLKALGGGWNNTNEVKAPATTQNIPVRKK